MEMLDIWLWTCGLSLVAVAALFLWILTKLESAWMHVVAESIEGIRAQGETLAVVTARLEHELKVMNTTLHTLPHTLRSIKGVLASLKPEKRFPAKPHVNSPQGSDFSKYPAFQSASDYLRQLPGGASTAAALQNVFGDRSFE